MEQKEVDTFKNKMVLAVCFAGSDRSRLVSEELDKRGYVSSYAGVNRNHNYVTEQDLDGIGSIIFTSQKVRQMFKKDKKLNKILKENQTVIHNIDVSESDKETALQSGELSSLRKTISEKLDALGFNDLRKNNFVKNF